MANSLKAPTGTLRFIRCWLGDESFALDMLWVRSIQRTDQFKPSSQPGGPDGWLPGRGHDIPVYKLAARLGRSTGQALSAQGRIVVLNPPLTVSTPPASPVQSEEKPWGLLIDRVSRVIPISIERVTSVPPVLTNPSANYFQGVIRLGEDLVLLLSPDELHPDAATHIQWPQRDHTTSTGEAQAPAPVTRGMNASVPETTRRKQILIFTMLQPVPGLRPIAFALSMPQVPEILNPMPMVPVPAAPPFVLGMINWRDRAVPVIDLGARLGLSAPGVPTAVDSRARLLIARGAGPGQMLAAFLIRPAVRALHLPLPHRPCRDPLPVPKGLTKGMVEIGDETVIIPDLVNILRQC